MYQKYEFEIPIWEETSLLRTYYFSFIKKRYFKNYFLGNVPINEITLPDNKLNTFLNNYFLRTLLRYLQKSPVKVLPGPNRSGTLGYLRRIATLLAGLFGMKMQHKTESWKIWCGRFSPLEFTDGINTLLCVRDTSSESDSWSWRICSYQSFRTAQKSTKIQLIAVVLLRWVEGEASLTVAFLSSFCSADGVVKEYFVYLNGKGIKKHWTQL